MEYPARAENIEMVVRYMSENLLKKHGIVIAKALRLKQSQPVRSGRIGDIDCFVARLLAMTNLELLIMLKFAPMGYSVPRGILNFGLF